MTALRSLPNPERERERERELQREQVLVALVPRVAAWCARLGGGTIDADAAASDVFEVLLRRWDDYDPSRPPEAWAWGITVRVVHHHRRQGWWRRWIPGLTVEPPPTRATGPADTATRELTALLHRLLDALSDDHRAVLVLHDLEERPAREVADVLDIPVGTVKSRVRLARVALRAEAERQGITLDHLREDPDDA